MATDTKTDGGAPNVAALKFRNYVPLDPAMRQWCLPRPSVEELEKQIDKEGREAIASAMNEDVASQITPRRPNWDLKRDIEKKLTILTRKTDRAILELVRRRAAESAAAEGLRDRHRADSDMKSLSQQEKEVVHAVVVAAKDLQKIDDDDDEP
eukprot:XP_028343348.1 coiled-coil domain-containing protein 12-like [Physeter catodon]